MVMERSEKALVPEWLKVVNGGTSGGGGNTTSHLSASSSQSDDHVVALATRSRLSIGLSDHDTPHSAFADRTSSSNFRRSSSSNGAMIREKDPSGRSRPYSSFGRSHHERDWERDHDFWSGDHDISDSLTLTNRTKKDTLRRSQSLISGKRGEVRRVGNDTSNGLLVGGHIMDNIQKAAFERAFPSLGAEEKQVVPDISRASSPGLSPASQNLPICAAVRGGECWTSALAQLPVTVGGSGILPSAQQTAPTSSAYVAPSITTGLNMAETLAQTPARTRTTPQLSVETQRREELAIKQSRQLIPMTPSMAKTSVPNSSEKLKLKPVRSSELSNMTKAGQQPSSSQLVNHAVHGTIRSDVSRPSKAGKLTVLKATHEKNDASAAKDAPSPTNASRVLPGVVQLAAFAPSRSSINPKLATDSKAAAISVTKNSMDRRPSQSRNRIDFFNSLRQKTSGNHSAAVPDSIPSVSSLSVLEKSDDQTTTIAAAVSEDAPESGPDLEWSPRNGSDVSGIGDACEDPNIDSSSYAVLFPKEEEVAFLRSMGWDENAEDDPLTEEEINAFYESLKLRPSKLPQGEQQSKLVLIESHVGSMGDASSILSSSDSEAEA
ncbi:hypothetical protein AAC387_Pa11g1962 [Persea americana]